MNVHGHYQGLLEKFTKCALESGFKVQAPRVRLKRVAPPDGQWNDLGLVDDGHISLKADVPSGTANRFVETLGVEDGHLEILIHPRERILNSAPWNIKRSQVEVVYLCHDRAKEVTDLLLALHFDFSVDEATSEPAEAHPLFHASLTHKPMELRSLLQQRNVVVDRMRGMPNLRLPTAHMTFPSVLTSVAADCFQPDQFAIFLRSVRDAGEYPTMQNDSFRQRMTAQQNRMRCCAWYANLAPALAW